MRNCRCFFFSSSASCTQRLLRFSALSPFFSLTTPLPATSHSQSQPQSCRLAWLSARVESFSVNGQPTPLPLLPSPLPATPADPFDCALPALCSSPSTCCFALSVVVAVAVVIVAVCFRPFFFSYASHAAPCPYFFFVRQATTRASVTVTAASASVAAATSSDHCSAEHARHSGTLTLKTDQWSLQFSTWQELMQEVNEIQCQR